MSVLTPQAEAWLSRMDTLGVCWKAVGDLLIPEQDLHIVDRDNLSILLNFLSGEYEHAQQHFRQALTSA